MGFFAMFGSRRWLGILACGVLALNLLACRKAPQVPEGGGGVPESAPEIEPLLVDDDGDPLPTGAIARLGSHRLRQRAGPVGLAFSPDGKTLVSAGGLETLAWDVATGKNLEWFKRTFAAEAVRFSDDGKVLVSASSQPINLTIQHWEAGTGKLLHRSESDDRHFNGWRSWFSANGKVMGVQGHYYGDVQFRVWDVESGKQLFASEQTDPPRMWLQALSPDGKTLLATLAGYRAQLIEISTGKLVREFLGPGSPPHLTSEYPSPPETLYCCTFSPRGDLLAAMGHDFACVWKVQTGNHIWRVRTGKLRHPLPANQGRLAFSPDGKYLALADWEGIRLFEASTGKETPRFEPHAAWINALTFSPDGKILAAAEAYAVSLWDVATGKRLHHFVGHESPVISLAFAPDNSVVASGDGQSGTLIVWDVKTRKPRYVLEGHYPGVRAIAYSADGKLLATGDGGQPYVLPLGLDAQIRIFNAAEGKLLRQFSGHLDGVQNLAFAPDGKALGSAGADERAKFWDVATGKCLHQMRWDRSWNNLESFSPDGQSLLLCSAAGELVVYRVHSGGKTHDRGAAWQVQNPLAFAAFLPHDKTIVAHMCAPGWKETSEIRIWDSESGRLIRSFPIENHHSYHEPHAISPDGRTLAAVGVADRTGTIDLWDMATGKLWSRFPQEKALALAFSADSQLLASSSGDTTVLLWDVHRARLKHVWSELAAGRDDAARAINSREVTRDNVVPFLKERLARVGELEVRGHRLIAGLDNDDFAVREKASAELEALGKDVAFVLHGVQQGSPSEEVRATVEKILDALKTSDGEPLGFQPETLEMWLALLEELGTPDAEQVLGEIAKGPIESTLVREARDASERLARRRRPH
jgi:WD40 repeat protein